jgi:hypothetical protein
MGGRVIKFSTDVHRHVLNHSYDRNNLRARSDEGRHLMTLPPVARQPLAHVLKHFAEVAQGGG